MTPAEDYPLDQLAGKKVIFRTGDDHAGCWHQQVGLQSGIIRRPARSLAQKAEMIAAEGVELPERFPTDDVPRVWVFADACASFPKGCEAAVEVDCLLVVTP